MSEKILIFWNKNNDYAILSKITMFKKVTVIFFFNLIWSGLNMEKNVKFYSGRTVKFKPKLNRNFVS